MPTPLPIFKIISTAFTFLWEKKLRIIRALLIPTVALLIIEIYPFLLLTFEMDYENIPLPLLSLSAIGKLIVTYSAYVLFPITCHRLVLMKNTSVPEYGMFSWTRREWWFLAYLIFLPLIYYLSIALFFMVQGLFMEFDIEIESFQILFTKGDGIFFLIFFVALPSVYIFSRLSLLFPATAVDRDVDVDWAWKTSKRNGWRLTVIIVLFPLIIGILPGWLTWMGVTWVESTISLLMVSSISLLLYLFMLALGIISLSFSYKYLTENEVLEAKQA